MRHLLFCLLLIGFAGCVKKEIPTTGAIHGVVKDSENAQPLVGCSVMLMPTGATTVTGTDGSFHFQDILPDTYSVEVSCHGYYTNKKSITVGVSDASMSVDILLTKYDPNNRLAELGTLKVGGITFRSARVECEIIEHGSSSITERGFLYSETPDVTIATATKKVAKTTEDIFAATLENLVEKTDYYVAAYAINGRGTAYSEVVKFTTGDASSISAPSNVIYVAVSGNDANDGKSWIRAKRTLKAALALATDQDQVWASAGTLDDTLYLKNGVPVYGGFKGTETTKDARTEKTRIKVIMGVGLTEKTVADGFQMVGTDYFNVATTRLEGNVALENCRFGEADKSSYTGFYCKGENNELKGCVIERHGYRGSFLISGGSLTMTDCIYRGNETSIQVGSYSSGSLRMYNCLVTNNTANGISISSWDSYNGSGDCIVELYNCRKDYLPNCCF